MTYQNGDISINGEALNKKPVDGAQLSQDIEDLRAELGIALNEIKGVLVRAMCSECQRAAIADITITSGEMQNLVQPILFVCPPCKSQKHTCDGDGDNWEYCHPCVAEYHRGQMPPFGYDSIERI